MKSSRMNAKQMVVGAVVLFGTTLVAAAQAPLPTAQAAGVLMTADVATPRFVVDQREESGPKGYNSAVAYRGSYDPNRIYRVELGLKMWRPNLKPEHLRNVTCSQAKRALEQDGTWYGRITRNGGCGNGDDTTWATGNYLNFLELPQRNSRGL